MHFNLAPLKVRRHIAVLGTLHRSAVGLGPSQLKEFFQIDTAYGFERRRRHFRHLSDPFFAVSPDYIARSAFGMIKINNMLPAWIVAFNTVSEFQSALQQLVKNRFAAGCVDWQETLEPTLPLLTHPLSHR